MALKLSVPVGRSVAIGGPATMRVEHKSGQAVALVFEAERSVPIRLIPEREQPDAPMPQGAAPVGLGVETRSDPSSPGLGRKP